MPRLLAGIMIVASLTALSGCTGGMFKNKALAHHLPADHSRVAGSETSDPWITAAGQEARSGMPTESAQDPLGLRRFTMSKRAREIEANFGVIEDPEYAVQ